MMADFVIRGDDAFANVPNYSFETGAIANGIFEKNWGSKIPQHLEQFFAKEVRASNNGPLIA